MPQSAEHVDALTRSASATACWWSPAATSWSPSWPATRPSTTWRTPRWPTSPRCACPRAHRGGAGRPARRPGRPRRRAARPRPDAPTSGCGWTGRSRSAAPAPSSPGTLPAGHAARRRRAGAGQRGTRAAPGDRPRPAEPRRAAGRVAGRGPGRGQPARACRGRRSRAATSLLTPGRWLRTAELDVRLSGVRGPRRSRDAARAADPARRVGGRAGPGAAAGRRHRPAAPAPPAPAAHRRPRGAARSRDGAGCSPALTVLDVAPPPLRRRGAAARRAESSPR